MRLPIVFSDETVCATRCRFLFVKVQVLSLPLPPDSALL